MTVVPLVGAQSWIRRGHRFCNRSVQEVQHSYDYTDYDKEREQRFFEADGARGISCYNVGGGAGCTAYNVEVGSSLQVSGLRSRR